MRFTRVSLLVALFALMAVPAAFAIRFTDDSFFMPTGTVGQPYSKTLGGAGGCGPALPYQYTVIGGTLPPGLSLSFSGTISGTPTTAGTYSFWVNLSDQNPPSASWCRPAEAQREFTITVGGGGGGGGGAGDGGGGGGPAGSLPKLKISSVAVIRGEVSVPFDAQLAASGGKADYKWSATNLPAGFTINPATGELQGRPAAAGSFPFKLTVTDSLGLTDSVDITLMFAPKLELTTQPLRVGKVGRAFSTRLAATGGAAPRGWTIVRGKLPAGLRFSNGAIWGAPQRAARVTLVVQVKDNLGGAARATFILTVKR